MAETWSRTYTDLETGREKDLQASKDDSQQIRAGKAAAKKIIESGELADGIYAVSLAGVKGQSGAQSLSVTVNVAPRPPE